jgi:hypothetical protein
MNSKISPDRIVGTWLVRFGKFGCPDRETRGGVVTMTPGQIIGGDNNFAYAGVWALDGTEFTASLDIFRHGPDPYLKTVFGTDEDLYRVEVTAEAITSDLFEGRIQRPGYPDARLVMRRFSASNGEQGHGH